MTQRKKRRLSLIALMLLLVGGATALVLTAFRDSVVFFYAPTELRAKEIPADRQLRVGGLVVEGSVEHHGEGLVTFALTDKRTEIPVEYRGLLPDLFAEGKGVVVKGRMNGNGVLAADDVLAKHDENYVPPEVAEALKESGEWTKGAPEGMTAE